MAVQDAPLPIDITDVQFKLHSKFHLFGSDSAPPHSNGLDLLATASTFGLIITGHPLAPELQIIQLKDVVDKKDESNVPRRQIQLPSAPQMLSLSCDHSMLAVTYVLNGSSFIDVYGVQSFLSMNVKCLLQKVHVSRDINVKVKHILWNPVIANTVAICLDDGTLGMYVLNETSFEYFTLDKSNEVRCASWSPKGKQIVVAFPNGKLAQYKPDLKLAKTIPMAAQLFSGPFNPIAVQWLSTYQFAVVFLEKKEEAGPMLYIINAPKNGQPTYINYDDICYGQPGPRASQVFLIHILPWNLILMGSANSTELGALGTDESGETPTWKQYIFLDEARAELPLTETKDDTFPIGLALETGTTHQVTIGENQVPVMPMVHILSTHGFLLSFNLLNFQPTAVGICSPPQPIADRSAIHLFCAISAEPKTPINAQQPPRPQLPQPQNLFQALSSNDTPSSNMTFVISENATSTPTKPPPNAAQTRPLFVAPEAKPSLLGAGTAPSFGNSKPFGSSGFAAPSFGQSALIPKEPPKSAVAAQVTQPAETAKPFLTVDQNYVPPAQNAMTKAATASPSVTGSSTSSVENDEILRKMISEEIQSFEKIIRTSLEKSKKLNVNVCSKEECSELLKSIGDLKEITTQAIKSTEDLSGEIQALRLTLFEAFTMSAEAQSKLDMLTDPKKGTGQEENMSVNQAHRRQLNKLQNLLSQNQARLDVVSKQIDANWSAHLDHVRENNRARMHIPSLENVYQTMEKQQQILMKEKMRINDIKAKIGISERNQTPSKVKYSFNKTDNPMQPSIIDSVLSMTIGDQISAERKPLNNRKLERLRQMLVNRPIRTVQPSLPDRKGLSSEVVIEKRIALAKEQKKKEKPRVFTEVAQPVAAKPTRPTNVIVASAAPQPSKPPSVPLTHNVAPNKNVTVTLSAQWQKPVPAQVSKASFGQTFTLNSGANPLSSTSTPSNVSIKSVPPVVVTASASFGLNKSPSASFTFTTPSAAEKNAPGFKVEAIKSDKPLFSFSNPPKPVSETVPSPMTKPVIAASAIVDKENLPNDKGASALGFGPKTSATPSSKSPAISAPSSKPLTIFGQAANATPIFGNASTASATDKTSIAAASPSIVKALLSNTPSTPKASEVSRPAPATAVASIATPATGFVFSSSPSTTSAPINLAKVSETKASAPAVATTTVSSPVTTFSFATATSASSPASIFGPPASAKPVTTPGAITASSPATTFNFAAATTTTPAASIFGTALTAKPPPTTAAPTTAAPATAAPATAAPVTAAPVTAAPATAASDTSSIFKGLGIASTVSSAAASITSSPFSSSVFGTPTATSTGPTPAIVAAKPSAAAASPASTFGFASGTPASSAASIFGGFGTPSTTASTAPPTAPAASADVGSIFKDFSICKPNVAENVNTSGSLFSGNSFGASNTFSSPTSAASIFGSPAASQTAASIFGGGGAATQTTASAANIFGGVANASPATPAANIFGSTTAGSGVFSATPASPFGGQPAQQTTGGSLFGSGFGGGGGGGFGQTNAFGSPTGTSGFGHGGASIAQTGFGSPPATSAFGLSAAAAAQPVFGQTPAFGQSATFGSPKAGFGAFSGASNAFASTTPQKNSLFESLGSSENAMTFGNLAQTSPPAPKPFSGGSSFSSWR